MTKIQTLRIVKLRFQKFKELFKEFGLKFVIIVNKAQIVYMRIRALRIGNKKLHDIKHILFSEGKDLVNCWFARIVLFRVAF